MSREAFHLLLDRYLEGKCTAEEKRVVEEWYGMLDKQDLEEINPREINTIEQKLWDRIHTDISVTPEPLPKIHSPKVWRWTAVAAAITGFCFITGYLFFKEQVASPQFISANLSNEIQQQLNLDAKPKKVVFEDGSYVLLEANASIKYPTHFLKDKREVVLEGTGFFQITTDASRPFMVYSKEVVTKVLGTSFQVVANADGNGTEVAVKTGKVAVVPICSRLALVDQLLGHPKEVILTPNQKTVFKAGDRSFEQSLVSNPEPLIATNKTIEKELFSFNDVPLAEVVATLKKTYGIDFIIEDPSLLDDTFTGDLTEQNLYSKLDFLCAAVKASYEISGTTIIIKNKK
ncbi:FecR family protein [Pedobacter gandavensis]|uniref:FecR family protein n=1 Tax=Pedobacter gandavensis TaxID=2679963 RepID=UPI00292D9D71|nr:FecR domain-containing protein [Pedobacter gandavensis]